MRYLFVLITFLTGLQSQNIDLKEFSGQIADVAERTNPAVVTILTEKKVKLGDLHQEIPFNNDFFRFFNPQNPEREFRTNALGSGVIVNSQKGYIVTNNHVVEDMDKVTVRLIDKREFKAEIVGRDPKSDVAILKIKADNLTDLGFGDSDKLRVGEWVIAVGSPFSVNLSHTVTLGIVSAKGRGNILGRSDFYEDFIQTDAAINPGNSGGALLNLDGELVGINTAIYTGGYDRSNKGVGFAIPSNMVKKVMKDLIEKGRVIRAWIGVQIQPLDDSNARALGLQTRDGALIADVVNNSPAEKAGLQTGDVILIFDGKKVHSVDHLRNIVSASTPNKRYDLKIVRDGRERAISVRLEEMPGDDVVLASTKQKIEDSSIGIKVKDISKTLLNEYGISGRPKGVIVINVQPGSPAARVGIRPGDIITRVGTKPVSGSREFKSMVKKAEKNDVVLLHVKRGNVARYVTIDLSE
ncbi:MAG: Do family serine endopeptidase [Fidelibacterota bacterium]